MLNELDEIFSTTRFTVRGDNRVRYARVLRSLNEPAPGSVLVSLRVLVCLCAPVVMFAE